MANYSYTEELKEVNGLLTLCVTAYRRVQGMPYSLEFYRRNEFDKAARNLYTAPMSGYVIRFPGIKYGSWYRETAELEEWGLIEHHLHPYPCRNMPTMEEKELIDRHYPGMRYVLAKCDLTYEEIFDLIPIWKKNPKVELLLAAGFKNIAFNKSFSRLTAKTAKKYLNALRDLEGYDPTMEQVRYVMKGWTINQYNVAHHWRFRDWRNRTWKCDLETAKYIESVGMDAGEYCDYIALVIKCGHDVNDPYWAKPKDFRKAHKKVLRQSRNIDRMNSEKAMAELQEAYFKKVKKFVGKVSESNGIKVYVPEFAKEYNRHAKALHQCLVYANYAQKVADGNVVLAFITKNGKPYATCEMVVKNKKLVVGQFYGDENLKNYHARPDAVEAFNNWAREFKIKVCA